MLLNKGKVGNTVILPEYAVEQMTELVPIRGQYDRQTVGMWRIFQDRMLIGHDGGERGFRSIAGFDPATGNGVIWLSNSWPNCECYVATANQIYTEYFGASASKSPPNQLQLNREAFFKSIGLPLPRKFLETVTAPNPAATSSPAPVVNSTVAGNPTPVVLTSII